MQFESSVGASAAMAPLSQIAERRNLSYRIMSGLVLGPLVLVLAFVGGPIFDIALAAATAFGLAEWIKLVTGRSVRWVYTVPLAVIGVYMTLGIEAGLVALVVLSLAVGLFVPVNRTLAALGLPYVGLTMLSLAWLHDVLDGGWRLVFFVFIVVWSTDIGAFFVGRLVRGPRLAPRISPNKTWSGFVGGLVFAGLIAIGLMALFPGASKPVQVVEIAIGLSLFGQGGDLFELAMKRKFGVKDSGDLIPGHGGMLDRIDALLWAAPAFALLHVFGLTAGLSP